MMAQLMRVMHREDRGRKQVQHHNKVCLKKKKLQSQNVKRKKMERLSESHFTPFRRAVCDWLFKEKAEGKELSYWQTTGPRTMRALSRRAFQFIFYYAKVSASEDNGQSRGSLGSVVFQGAADSLLHSGEVLCLAKFPAHTRHIGTAQVNTESLQREQGDKN